MSFHKAYNLIILPSGVQGKIRLFKGHMFKKILLMSQYINIKMKSLRCLFFPATLLFLYERSVNVSPIFFKIRTTTNDPSPVARDCAATVSPPC